MLQSFLPTSLTALSRLFFVVVVFDWTAFTIAICNEGRWECYSLYIEQKCFSYFLSMKCTTRCHYLAMVALSDCQKTMVAR